VSEVVLDASALLAMLNREPGHEGVARVVPEAAVSAVNLSGVVAKLAENGMPGEEIEEALEGLALEIHDFGRDLAFQTGLLHLATRSRGLSLGDRACLALGKQLHLPVLTTDRAWEGLELGVEVRLVRS
jgi:PIN domain nuclease of toxin-antitoxin system